MKFRRSALIVGLVVASLSIASSVVVAVFGPPSWDCDAFCEEPWSVLSSVTSPNGKLVAENSLGSAESAGGRLTVKTLDGTTHYEMHFTDTEPGLFLQWVDDKHLSIVSDKYAELSLITSHMTDSAIEVSYSSSIRYDARDASLHAKIHLEETPIAANVLATFEEKRLKTRVSSQCVLNVSAKDGKVYDVVGMRIAAASNSCSKTKCGDGIETHFSVGQRLDHGENQLLTSATVSEIPSHNASADVGNGTIRGSFNDPLTDLSLIGALNNSSFDIDYNFDFIELNIRYKISTSAISQPISDFTKCVAAVR